MGTLALTFFFLFFFITVFFPYYILCEYFQKSVNKLNRIRESPHSEYAHHH